MLDLTLWRIRSRVVGTLVAIFEALRRLAGEARAYLVLDLVENLLWRYFVDDCLRSTTPSTESGLKFAQLVLGLRVVERARR